MKGAKRAPFPKYTPNPHLRNPTAGPGHGSPSCDRSLQPAARRAPAHSVEGLGAKTLRQPGGGGGRAGAPGRQAQRAEVGPGLADLPRGSRHPGARRGRGARGWKASPAVPPERAAADAPQPYPAAGSGAPRSPSRRLRALASRSAGAPRAPDLFTYSPVPGLPASAAPPRPVGAPIGRTAGPATRWAVRSRALGLCARAAANGDRGRSEGSQWEAVQRSRGGAEEAPPALPSALPFALVGKRGRREGTRAEGGDAGTGTGTGPGRGGSVCPGTNPLLALRFGWGSRGLSCLPPCPLDISIS